MTPCHTPGTVRQSFPPPHGCHLLREGGAQEEPSVLKEAAQLGSGRAEIRTQAVGSRDCMPNSLPYTSEDSGRGDGASGLKMLSFVASHPGGLQGSEAVISTLTTFQWPGD